MSAPATTRRAGPRRLVLSALLMAAGLGAGVPVARAGEFEGTIQAAIDAASPGDVIDVPAGVYEEDLDFGGKAVVVRGSGPHSVLQGTGTGPVVTFSSGEGPDSVLDSFTVTGGRASSGGGVLIVGASPTVIRCTITANMASSAGSGISIAGGSSARIFNNVISYNTLDGSGDPHGIQVSGSSPAIVNNTIVRNDSNGILVSGSAVILNNVLAWNGSKVGGQSRGRGICDFSNSQATIRNNVFHRNRVSALLRGGKDWKRMGAFQKQNPDDARVGDNLDGNPGYFRRAPKDAAALSCLDMLVCNNRPGRAVHAGLDEPGCLNLDGSRNTAGHTGGPFAPGSRELPGDDACGVAPLPTL